MFAKFGEIFSYGANREKCVKCVQGMGFEQPK